MNLVHQSASSNFFPTDQVAQECVKRFLKNQSLKMSHAEPFRINLSHSKSMQELSSCANADKNEKTIRNTTMKRNTPRHFVEAKQNKESKNEMVKKGDESNRLWVRKNLEKKEITATSSESYLLGEVNLEKSWGSNKWSDDYDKYTKGVYNNPQVYSVGTLVKSKFEDTETTWYDGSNDYTEKSNNKKNFEDDGKKQASGKARF